MFKTVLLPLDGSARAESVLETVAKLQVGELRLLRVSDVPQSFPLDLGPQIREAEEAACQAYMEKRRAELEAQGYRVSTVVRKGNPAHEILAEADDCGAELIAIVTHGHSGLSRFLLGSAAERIVRHANCPVLIVRTT